MQRSRTRFQRRIPRGAALHLVAALVGGCLATAPARAAAAWTPIGPYLTTAVNALAAEPNDPRVLYAATPSGVYRTRDGAQTWQSAVAATPGASLVVTDPLQPSTLYCEGRAISSVFRSLDGGASWARVGRGLPDTEADTALAVSTAGPRALYFATSDRGVFKLQLP